MLLLPRFRMVSAGIPPESDNPFLGLMPNLSWFLSRLSKVPCRACAELHTLRLMLRPCLASDRPARSHTRAKPRAHPHRLDSALKVSFASFLHTCAGACGSICFAVTRRVNMPRTTGGTRPLFIQTGSRARTEARYRQRGCIDDLPQSCLDMSALTVVLLSTFLNSPFPRYLQFWHACSSVHSEFSYWVSVVAPCRP